MWLHPALTALAAGCALTIAATTPPAAAASRPTITYTVTGTVDTGRGINSFAFDQRLNALFTSDGYIGDDDNRSDDATLTVIDTAEDEDNSDYFTTLGPEPGHRTDPVPRRSAVRQRTVQRQRVFYPEHRLQ